MDQRMSLITPGERDLVRARCFYETGLGWQVGMAVGNEVVFFQLNGLILLLFSRLDLSRDAGVPDAGTGFAGISLAYNPGFTIDAEGNTWLG